MIYDCFLYSGEKELLKIRTEEFKHLEPLKHLLPIKHVVVESEYTFTGKKKSLDFAFSEEFPADSFIWQPLLDQPYSDPWLNEQRQRNAIKSALAVNGVNDDDIIIISDVDEIPRAYALQHYRPELGICALQMDVYYYFLNTISQRQSWVLPRIMTWKNLKYGTPDGVRKAGFNLCLYNAGWHFSYQGGVDAILAKFSSFSHQEEAVQKFANREVIEKKMKDLEYLWDNTKMYKVPDADIPYYVQQNKERYKHMLYV